MEAGVAEAVRTLRRGGLVVYPTDTLLGLGALATRRDAVERLVRAKGRSASQPISVCVSSTEELERFARLTPAARRFVRRYLPGPYTVLLPPSTEARRRFAPAVAGSRSVGFRIPDHPVARRIARHAGPITATSANRHGAPASRTIAEARRAFGRAVGVYVAALPAGSGVGSTLVDLTGPEPREVARGG